MHSWIKYSEGLPKVNIVVITRIDNSYGIRIECLLKRQQGTPLTKSLWFFSRQ